jgi:hypothetical protein
MRRPFAWAPVTSERTGSGSGSGSGRRVRSLDEDGDLPLERDLTRLYYTGRFPEHVARIAEVPAQ